MAERLVHLFPQFVICIVLSVFLAILVVKVSSFNKASRGEWAKKNPKKFFWFLIFPAVCGWAPVFEELIFRGPLVIFFGGFSFWACAGIFVSAFVFALAHIPGAMEDFNRMYKCPEYDPAMVEEFIRAEDEREENLLAYIQTKFILMFVLGAISGVIGIYFGSLFASVLVHFIWNLLAVALSKMSLVKL